MAHGGMHQDPLLPQAGTNSGPLLGGANRKDRGVARSRFHRRGLGSSPHLSHRKTRAGPPPGWATRVTRAERPAATRWHREQCRSPRVPPSTPYLVPDDATSRRVCRRQRQSQDRRVWRESGREATEGSGRAWPQGALARCRAAGQLSPTFAYARRPA